MGVITAILHYIYSGWPNLLHSSVNFANVYFLVYLLLRLRLLLVMEMMEGGELFDRISHHKHFTERQAAFYTMQVGCMDCTK